MTAKLSDVFNVSYGNKLDFNKMTVADGTGAAVNFVGRSSKNNGVVAKVEIQADKIPYGPGCITVALGGTKLLSSFVQAEPFYTAQNLVVLTPPDDMSFAEKIFYCLAIRHNRFRYSAFGREANRTIKQLAVPARDELPPWFDSSVEVINQSASPALEVEEQLTLDVNSWQPFQYDALFEIVRGRGPRRNSLDDSGTTPFITSTDANNGLTGLTSMAPIHPGNTITVNRNGSVGEAYYQPVPFCSTEDVHVFMPRFEMDKYIAMFFVTLIRREKYRYTATRKNFVFRFPSSGLHDSLRAYY